MARIIGTLTGYVIILAALWAISIILGPEVRVVYQKDPECDFLAHKADEIRAFQGEQK